MVIRATALTSSALKSAIVRDPLIVPPDATVQSAIAHMNHGRTRNQTPQAVGEPLDDRALETRASCVWVVDGPVIGMLTERDVVRLSAEPQPLGSLVIRDVMVSPARTLRESALTDVWLTMKLLQQSHGRPLPILDEQDRLVGLVTDASLLHALQGLELHDGDDCEERAWEPADAPSPSRPVLDNAELYQRAEVLEAKVVRLEAEKLALLASRTAELEQEVENRTIALKAKAEREKLLAELATQIRSSLSLPTILDTTVEQVRQVLGCDRVLVYQFQPDWSGIMIAESVEQGWLSALGNKINDSYFQRQTTTLYASELPIVVNSIYTAGYTDCHVQLLEHYQVKASVVVPIRVEGHLWGLLIGHQCAGYRDWQREDITLLQGISVQLAIALQQAIIHQQLQAELNERQQAEARLQQSEAHQRALITALPDLIMRVNRSGIYLEFIAPSNFSVVGNISNMVGTHVYQTLPFDLAQRRMDCIQRALETHTIQIDEQDLSNLFIDGRTQIEEMRVVPYSEDEVLLVLRDISDRKHTERALERLNAELEERVAQRTNQLLDQEAQLRDFLENANDLIQSVLVEDGHFEYVNRAWRETLGYSEQDVQNLTIFDVLHPDYRDHCREAIAQMQAGILCTLDHVELVFLTKTQQPIRVEGSINCRFDDHRCVATRAIFRDITERKAAEQLLQDREARYRALMDGASDAILVADFQGKLLEVNRKAEELFGYSRDQLTQLHQAQLHPPEDFKHVTAAFNDVIQQECTQLLDTRILRQDGQTVSVDISATIVNIGDTKIIQGIFRNITERKKSETALRESQQFLQTVLDTFPLSVFWKDRASIYLGCNQQFAKTVGLRSPLEVIGKTDFELSCTGIEAQGYRADDHQVIESGIAKLGIEEIITLPTGETRWLETNKVPLRNLAGQVIATVGTFQDISDRKQAEQAMKQQLAAIEAAIDGIAFLQGDTYLHVNQAHLDLFGYTDPAELVGQSWTMLYSPEELERFEREIFPVLARDHAWQGEAIAIRKDGTPFDEGLSLTLTEDGLLICVCRDISDRKQAETELQTSRAYYQGIIADQTELICRFLADGTLTFVNDAYCKFFQKLPEELVGQSFSPLLPDSDNDIPRQHFKTLSIENPVVTYERRVIAPDGTLHWQQWTDRTLFDPDGQFIEFQSVGRDITALKEAEVQLRQTNEELARATRLKDEFLANMSHELRTPLNAVLGMTEGLQEEVFGQINSAQAKALQTIERSGTHLLELINDILDVAKIEAGQLELDCIPTAVAPLCQSSLAFIKQQALQKRIQLQVNLPPHLPDLLVDERRIRQVLINLLNNAVKFTLEGGHITLEANRQRRSANPDDPHSSPQDFLRITIADTGIGIAPEHRSKLFHPFIQIDSALNRQYQGTGLGLALVKRIVELHGGYVGLTSEVGIGSRFMIDLPCAIATTGMAALDTADSDGIQASQFAPELSPLILLAEDNEANIRTVSSYLRAKGYCILLAKTGQEAIALAQASTPDVILMDIQMPGMDGIEAMQQLRQDPTLVNVPIIALTALAMNGDRERCLAAGASGYLTKPVKLKQLAITIQQLLIP